jgi:hypothetical protein
MERWCFVGGGWFVTLNTMQVTINMFKLVLASFNLWSILVFGPIIMYPNHCFKTLKKNLKSILKLKINQRPKLELAIDLYLELDSRPKLTPKLAISKFQF